MKPKVSVIIPVYNAEKYIEKCLDTVCSQTLKDLEIIVINDGSVDNSLKIINEYKNKDERIVVINSKNQGPSGARNQGLDIAKGDYIGFVDADDWCELTMFEKLYNKATKNNLDIVMCYATTFNAQTEVYNYEDTYFSMKDFPENLKDKTFTYKDIAEVFFRIPVIAWNKLYKRELIIDNNIKFPDYLYFEDNVFSLHTLIKAKRIELLEENLIYYRQFTKHSITQKDETKLDLFKVFDEMQTILDKNDTENILQTRYINHKNNTFKYWSNRLQNEKIKEIFNQNINAHISK